MGDVCDAGVEALFAVATRDAKARNWQAAHAGFSRVVEREPLHAEAMLHLCHLEARAGHYRASRDWAVRAAASDRPMPAESTCRLVRRLRGFSEATALRAFVSRLLDDPRAPHAVLVESAWQLSSLNDLDLAQRCVDKVLSVAPHDPTASLVRGHLLAHRGRVDEAGRQLAAVVRRSPRLAIGWWLLSRLRTQDARSNHVAPLRALLRTPGIKPSDVAVYARALHKELDDLGDHAGAWQALELLCRSSRTAWRYDRTRNRAIFDALVDWPTTAAGMPFAEEDATTPIFIVGMHRSGTTLLEQLLDGSPEVRALGELDDFAAAMRDATDHPCAGTLDRATVERSVDVDFAGVGRRYMQGLQWRLGEERLFTDKHPANFLNIGFILRALPRARILHLVRDPVETCFSNLRELFFGINSYAHDQLDLADYFLQYRRLMAHWHSAFPGRILDVSYAGLTGDTEATMRDVAGHCGIAYHPAMGDSRSSRRAVTTASSIQVRDGVVSREVPKWAPYASHLQPLVQALRDGGIEVAELPDRNDRT